MDTIVSAVISLLETHGQYRSIPLPLKLADIEFQFEAALLGPEGYGDIVLVTSTPELHILRRQLLAFVTLLDRQFGKHSVSLILIARAHPINTLHTIEQYCRVICIHPACQLEEVLRPLLRLTLPSAQRKSEDPKGLLLRELGELASDDFLVKLIEAASVSPEQVHTVLKMHIQKAATFPAFEFPGQLHDT